jgi:perosamine synthetase
MADPLAIDGGPPVRDTLLPYGHQMVDEADVEAVAKVLRSDWLTTGPAVEEYEQAFAEYVGARHAVAVTSGTAALHAAVFAAGIGPGDEVITSPLSFAASANCVLYCGGRPIFADVQEDTCNIDPASIEARITDKTKAIIAVDYSGQPADLDEIRKLAVRHELVFIEDAAHALGASCRGRRIGQWADLTVFSTHPVKPITTGEGGMVVTDDAASARTMRAFRSHGVTVDAQERAERGDWHYDMAFLGYNYRMPDILCALGTSQLTKLDGWLARRGEIAQRYDRVFKDVAEVERPVVRRGRISAWHLYVLRLRLEELRVGRQQVFQALRAEGIGVNVHYIPIYWHSHYKRLGYAKGLCPVAEAQYERLITLPLWPGMSDADVDDVIAAVKKVIGAYCGY